MIVKTYAGSPSYEAGMMQGDYIVEVDGEDVSALDLSTIVSKIKGEEGTPVSLEVYRVEEDEYVTFDLVRRRVEIPSVAGEMLDERIGYIQIESWDMLTNSQFQTVMEQLLSEGMKGLVVDVRNNPGGLVNAAANVLDYFVEDGGRLLYSVDKNDKETDYMAQDGLDSDIPLVVLTNGQSASSSEIFAGGIRDYKAGTLVGEKTFGKGIVQNIIDIGNGEAIKLTVAEYYLPSEVCIHGEGIEPDVKVQLPEALKKQSVISHEEDDQLQKAIEILGDKME
jgi:carboxyl-terminal processing protease